MNSINLSGLTEALATLQAPGGPRAILVSLGRDGAVHTQPVASGQSVVNITDELIDHLSAYPHTTEWLEVLRDYCAGRLAARDEAKRTGGFVIPRAPGRWDIAHVQAFQPVVVR